MRITVLILCVLVAALGVLGVAAEGPLLGFPGDRAREQRELEARFDAELRADHLRDWMERLSARPHHVGSPFGKEVAELLAEQFQAWGYDTTIETFHVLFPTPRTRRLEMVSPTRFVATLAEPAILEDATSGQQAEQLPTYNAYSIDGTVTADLVYVNYEIPGDYDELERRGIDVTGKIVMPAMGAPGEESNRRSPRNRVPSGASSIRTRAMTGTHEETSIRVARIEWTTAYNAVRSPTCRSFPAIR